MSEPFIGNISIFGFNFAPRSWAKCDGQLLPINQNQSLFSLLGTTYGGDGRTSFALPDMRSRAPMHAGNGSGLSQRNLGSKPGSEQVTLAETQIPAHGHAANGSVGNATTGTPQGNLPAPVVPSFNVYADSDNLTAGAPGQISGPGSATPHQNMQPFNTLNFCIALAGLFPSRN